MPDKEQATEVKVLNTSGGDKYRVEYKTPDGQTWQGTMTKDQIEKAGGQVPEQLQRAKELHRIEVEEGYVAGKEKKEEYQETDAARQLAERENITEKAARETLQRYKDNPKSEEWATLTPAQRQNLAELSGVKFSPQADIKQYYEQVNIQGTRTGADIEQIPKAEAERIKAESPQLYEVLKKYGIKAYEARAQEGIRYDYQLAQESAERAKEKFERENKVIDGKAIPIEDWRALPYRYQQIALSDGYDGLQTAINQEVRAFELKLREQPLELRTAYVKGGFSEYEKALEEYNRRQANKVKFFEEYELIVQPEELQEAYKKGGIDAYNRAVDTYNRKNEEAYNKYQSAVKELEPYKAKDGDSYDIVKYLKENNASDINKERVLYEAGYDQDTIKEAQYLSELNLAQSWWQGLTPWNETKGEKVNAAGGLQMAAELLVPGLYLAREWDKLEGWQKALMIVADVAVLVPVASAAARGARGVATAGRGTRFAGALRGIGAEARAQALAPVLLFRQGPITAAKATGIEVRGLVENLLHPKRIPEAVITTTNGTIRLKVGKNVTKETALAFQDKIMELAAKGEKPIVTLKTAKGDIVVELAQSPLMKELKGGLAHATPMAESFAEGITVAYKPGQRAAEQGLFMANQPLPRFAEATARGVKGETAAFIIVSPETAKLAKATGKLYFSGNPADGLVAEMERVFGVGTTLPKPAQKLFTRIGLSGHKVEIWLEKPLTLKQIAKLKAQGIIELITQPFKPAIKVSGGALSKQMGLTKRQIDELAKTLIESGNRAQAASLRRAYPLSMAVRAPLPILERIVQRYSATGRQAEYDRIAGRDMRRAVPLRTIPAPIRAAAMRRNIPERELRELREIDRAIMALPVGLRGRKLTEALRRVLGRELTRAELTRIQAREGGTVPVTRLTGRTTVERIPPRVPGRTLPERVAPRTTRTPVKEKPAKVPVRGTAVTLQEYLSGDKEIRAKLAPITWYQGKLKIKGKLRPQWYVIYPPYTNKTIKRQFSKPQGAIQVEGPGAAYNTIQALGESAAFMLDMDWGAFDLTVTRPSKTGEKKALRFKRDVKGQTKKPLSVSDIPTVSAVSA